MTGSAVLGRRLVKEHGLSFHLAGLLMASGATHVTMHPLQRKRCAGVVVKKRWLPLGTVVTPGTGRGLARFCELGAVNIGVATFAGRRRYFEIDIDELGLQI